MDEFKFNWTMSYKLKSEASHGTYGFYSTNEKIIDSKSFMEDLKKEFNSRKTTALWFVSNCDSIGRNIFVTRLSQRTEVKFSSLFKLDQNHKLQNFNLRLIFMVNAIKF